ncbi:sensor histidine kinase [Corynebacterium frankenforstense]|uniref:sensor histidine kinase n=1 Tax=Corynebacterium frankenforstense TaxID=1230998 RepID=UPI0009521917|nr:histidine kinase [Corynebacterium frankenforstense]
MGTTSLTAMPPDSRPASFPAIATYIRSTHAVLVLAALFVPVGVFVAEDHNRMTGVGIVLAGLVGVLGGLALFTEAVPGPRFSRLWRSVPVRATWSIAMVAGSALLVAIMPGTSGGLSAAVLPVALALRAVAIGSLWTSSLQTAVAAAACLLVALACAEDRSLDDLGLTVAVGALLAFAVIAQDAVYALALEVDDLRTREAERAVTHERQRFAGDLHDIQGQHLQLLAVEAQLVQRLIDTGRLEDARKHASRLREIAATALDEMRSVVHAYRAVSVKTEAANAARVLTSAGITVRVDCDAPPALSDTADRLLGRTIREGITNILRHTRAERCEIGVRPEKRAGREGVSLTLTDSGPAVPQSGSPGSGLDTLARRYAGAGGRLTFTSTDDDGGHLDAWLPLSTEAQ